MEHPPALKVKKLRPNASCRSGPHRVLPASISLARIDGNGTVALGPKPTLIGTGIAIEVPKGHDAQIRPRSGLSSRGVGVAFGTVDSDYRGEVMVTMYLFDPEPSFDVRHGDGIAQLVITKLAELPMVEAEELTPTECGAPGHGFTASEDTDMGDILIGTCSWTDPSLIQSCGSSLVSMSSLI